MGKVIWRMMMSLDGFIAGPYESMDWGLPPGWRSDVADTARDETGAIIGGRRWYDVANARYNGVDGNYGSP